MELKIGIFREIPLLNTEMQYRRLTVQVTYPSIGTDRKETFLEKASGMPHLHFQEISPSLSRDTADKIHCYLIKVS